VIYTDNVDVLMMMITGAGVILLIVMMMWLEISIHNYMCCLIISSGFFHLKGKTAVCKSITVTGNTATSIEHGKTHLILYQLLIFIGSGAGTLNTSNIASGTLCIYIYIYTLFKSDIYIYMYMYI
jgi:hypothetical protein